MKKYVFELIIEEGNDHFWSEITDTGVNQVTEAIKETLAAGGWDPNPAWGVSLTLLQYSNKP